MVSTFYLFSRWTMEKILWKIYQTVLLKHNRGVFVQHLFHVQSFCIYYSLWGLTQLWQVTELVQMIVFGVILLKQSSDTNVNAFARFPYQVWRYPTPTYAYFIFKIQHIVYLQYRLWLSIPLNIWLIRVITNEVSDASPRIWKIRKC